MLANSTPTFDKSEFDLQEKIISLDNLCGELAATKNKTKELKSFLNSIKKIRKTIVAKNLNVDLIRIFKNLRLFLQEINPEPLES